MPDEIIIERTKEFTESAKSLSDFISALPLSVEQNDKLVHGMVEQVKVAERAAFKQGFVTGIEYAVNNWAFILDAENN